MARWIERETGREKVWNQRGWDYLKKCGYSRQSPRSAHKKADDRAWQLEQEIFKANLPLKPILKKVWSKIGNRPEAIVQHRYEWLYVYGFVQPKTGKSLDYLIAINTSLLNIVYRQFALDAQVNEQKKFFW